MTSASEFDPGRIAPAGDHQASNPWLHRYALCVAVCTGILVFAGGLVTSTDSGLSVPDWPLSYGTLFPPMVGSVRFEHGHRMIATFVGMLTIVLAVWLQKRESRSTVRRLGWVALGAVVAQGVLGGITVLLQLPTVTSVGHACLGQSFFCITVAIALLTSPGWRRLRPDDAMTRGLRVWCVALSGAVFVQLILGAWMRHSGAGLAIPDFPLAFGGLVPSFQAPGVALHFAHRVVGTLIAIVAVGLLGHVWRRQRLHAALLQPAVLLGVLCAAQLALGGLTVLSRKSPAPTTLHVLTGAMILATTLVLAMRAGRLAVPTPVSKPAVRGSHPAMEAART